MSCPASLRSRPVRCRRNCLPKSPAAILAATLLLNRNRERSQSSSLAPESTSIDAALDASTLWQPDAVIADAVDFVGPLVAAALRIPHALVAFRPALPPEFVTQLFAVAASRHGDRGLELVPPAAMFDPSPPLLQADGWKALAFTIPFQPAPHRREGVTSGGLFAHSGDRIPLLLTLGTLFGNDTLLGALVQNLASG